MAVEFRAWVRSRRLEDEDVHYGLEFDSERSEDFGRQQDEIIEYVMVCQREALKRRVVR